MNDNEQKPLKKPIKKTVNDSYINDVQKAIDTIMTLSNGKLTSAEKEYVNQRNSKLVLLCFDSNKRFEDSQNGIYETQMKRKTYTNMLQVPDIISYYVKREWISSRIYEYKITHRMLYRFRTKQSHETKKGNEEYASIPCPVNFDKIKNVEYSNDSKPPYWIKRKFLEDYGITLISGKLDQGIMLVKLP